MITFNANVKLIVLFTFISIVICIVICIYITLDPTRMYIHTLRKMIYFLICGCLTYKIYVCFCIYIQRRKQIFAISRRVAINKKICIYMY